ncbi:major facilitator superfamily domain-containing protein [Vararia minispora EC-137]|uniref:Major facilitator superfamily domain-containing protein n=1 Tax=Vararia minispora EC-137 TaxID=1314806 RepID=A0ACB8QKB2_9AGAM|nr:major facilitator superfamily domain-containing protein [Vararia minispora EC-137]
MSGPEIRDKMETAASNGSAEVLSPPHSSDAAPKSSVSVPKDGGLEAWCTLLGAWLILIATFGYTSAFGVYQDFYTRSGVTSTSRISWIGSTQLFLMLFISVPAGKLLDAGYFRQTTAFGSALYVFSLFMLSLAHPDRYYQIFLSQGLGMGIGAGLIYVPALAVQAHHWRRRRPLAMGLAITGSSVGGIFFSIMLNQLLFHRGISFAWAVRNSAFVVLGLLVAANILMRDRPEVTRTSAPKPDIGALFKDIPYVVAILSAFLIDWGLFFPYFYLQLFAIIHGVDANVAFYMLAVLNGASIPGRILFNGLSPRFGVFNFLIFTGIACAVLIFAMFGVSSVAGVAVLSVLYGFFSGAFLSLLTPAVAVLSKHEGEIGTRVGIAYGLSCLGTLTGTPVDGALLGDTFPWWRAIVFSGVMTIAGILLMLVTRQYLTQRKNTQFV